MKPDPLYPTRSETGPEIAILIPLRELQGAFPARDRPGARARFFEPTSTGSILSGHSVVNPNETTRRTPSVPSILIAEDNPDSRDALRALLEAYGFNVLEAENGEEAVSKALRFGPDLILMDIMMPVMDGLTATRTLRASHEFRQVPILALTAMAGAQQLAMNAGCDDHLRKPVEVPDFIDTIRSFLTGSEDAGAPDGSVGA